MASAGEEEKNETDIQLGHKTEIQEKKGFLTHCFKKKQWVKIGTCLPQYGWGQRHFVSLCLVARRARCVRAYFPETSDIPTLKPAVVFP